MNSALTCAIYFIICRYLNIDAPMPTNRHYWEGTDDASSSALIAAFSVFAATHPNCSNEDFNIVNGDHFVWRWMWPRLASYFGAQASPSQQFSSVADVKDLEDSDGYRTATDQEFSLVEWADGKREVWHKLCDEMNCPTAKPTFDYGTWAFQDWVFRRTWTATLSMNKARKFGWTGHVDSYENYVQTFQEFEQLGLLPALPKT